MPIGTLTKKIHSQPMPDVITPPMIGPTATAPPITPPYTPKARPRSLPWKAPAIKASEVANIIGPAGALHGAREVQRERRTGQPASGGGERENDQPGDEHQPPPEAVGERAGGQQEGGERQRVGVDDPLQVGEARVQRALDVRKRDVDDGDVEQQHEDRHRDGDQRPPLALHDRSPCRCLELPPRTI